MRNKQICSVVLIMSLFFGASAQLEAAEIFSDTAEFIKNNPDGKKFEFVRDYLTGLKYLWLNDQRISESEAVVLNSPESSKKLKALIKNIHTSNLNIRTVRNLISDFRTPENGLILKVSDLFIKVCEEQVNLNNAEKSVLEEALVEIKRNGTASDVLQIIAQRRRALFSQRKESLKGMLEASFLVKKVLISNQTDRYGELVMLGITATERARLLAKLGEFSGENLKGELREGLSFVEGSVVVIRNILEDESWHNLDG
jgi:hypothetical protein